MRNCLNTVNKPSEVKVAGIDPSLRRPSGVAVIEGGRLKSWLADWGDVARDVSGSLVIAIDAPLTLPKSGYFRDVDKAMVRLGLRVLPPGWRWMRELALRSIELASRLREGGSIVIETHPRSVLKYLNIGSLEELASLLGVTINEVNGGRDAVDAAVCALVAYSYVICASESVKGSDGEIYLVSRRVLNHNIALPGSKSY